MGQQRADAGENRPARRATPVLLRPRVHAGLVAVSATSWALLPVLWLLPGSDGPHGGMSSLLVHGIATALSAAATRLCLFGVRSRMQLLGFWLASGLFEIGRIWMPGGSAGLDSWAASTAGALAGLMAARCYAHRTVDRRTHG